MPPLQHHISGRRRPAEIAWGHSSLRLLQASFRWQRLAGRRRRDHDGGFAAGRSIGLFPADDHGARTGSGSGPGSSSGPSSSSSSSSGPCPRLCPDHGSDTSPDIRPGNAFFGRRRVRCARSRSAGPPAAGPSRTGGTNGRKHAPASGRAGAATIAPARQPARHGPRRERASAPAERRRRGAAFKVGPGQIYRVSTLAGTSA